MLKLLQLLFQFFKNRSLMIQSNSNSTNKLLRSLFRPLMIKIFIYLLGNNWWLWLNEMGKLSHLMERQVLHICKSYSKICELRILYQSFLTMRSRLFVVQMEKNLKHKSFRLNVFESLTTSQKIFFQHVQVKFLLMILIGYLWNNCWNQVMLIWLIQIFIQLKRFDYSPSKNLWKN